MLANSFDPKIISLVFRDLPEENQIIIVCDLAAELAKRIDFVLGSASTLDRIRKIGLDNHSECGGGVIHILPISTRCEDKIFKFVYLTLKDLKQDTYRFKGFSAQYPQTSVIELAQLKNKVAVITDTRRVELQDGECTLLQNHLFYFGFKDKLKDTLIRIDPIPCIYEFKVVDFS